MRAQIIVLLALASLPMGGCGGYYILTVPEQVAPAGAETAVIARLQRNDVFVLAPPVAQEPLRFRLAGAGPERAGYTDKLGYAGTVLRAPREPGRHELTVALQDKEGEQVSARGAVYVLDPARLAVVVDCDSLPDDGHELAEAASVLAALAKRAEMIYLTRQPVKRQGDLHAKLALLGYPDGAVLTWRRQRWHIVRDGRFNWPRVVVEPRLVSQLPDLRDLFPRLTVGICDSDIAARAFADAGLRPVLIGESRADIDIKNLTCCESWAQVAQLGL